MTSALDDEVVELRYRATGTDAWSDALAIEDAEEGDDAAAAGTYQLYVEAADAETVDFKLKLASGEELEFAEVPLAEGAKLTFAQADEVVYVDYTLADGTEGSTKDAALARKAAEEEAARKAEEEAKKKAEEEAARKAAEEEAARKAEEEARAAEEAAAAQSYEYAEPTYSEPTYSEPTYYEEPSYDSYDGGGYEAPAQSEDQCLDDPIFLD